MYEPKKKLNLSHLFKLKMRKRSPIVRVNYNGGEGWQAIKGVTDFTEPTLRTRQHEWHKSPQDNSYLMAFFDNKSIKEIEAMFKQEPNLEISE